MSKHTPGPWRAEIQYQYRTGRPLGWIIEHDAGRIGWESTAFKATNSEAAPDDPVREANARLIAAAPELLEALKAMQRQLRRTSASLWTNEQAEADLMACAAIAKATGSAA